MAFAAPHVTSPASKLLVSSETSGVRRPRNYITTARQTKMEIADKNIKHGENKSAPKEMRVTALLRYPIKSTGAEHVMEAEITAEGLRGDRRFVVTNRDGVALTQRQVPRLAIIEARTIGNQLHLRTAEGHSFNVSITSGGAPAVARIFVDGVSLTDQGTDVGHWLEQVLDGNAVDSNFPWPWPMFPNPRYRLLYARDDSWQTGNLIRRGAGLSDMSPLHLLCEESVQDLNARRNLEGLPKVPLDRFRPNIVISGCPSPNAEADAFQAMRIGNTVFRVSPCPRCTVPNVNQHLGKSDEVNSGPMSTLKRYRKGAGGSITFGAYLEPLNYGEIVHIGAEVEATMAGA